MTLWGKVGREGVGRLCSSEPPRFGLRYGSAISDTVQLGSATVQLRFGMRRSWGRTPLRLGSGSGAGATVRACGPAGSTVTPLADPATPDSPRRAFAQVDVHDAWRDGGARVHRAGAGTPRRTLTLDGFPLTLAVSALARTFRPVNRTTARRDALASFCFLVGARRVLSEPLCAVRVSRRRLAGLRRRARRGIICKLQ